MKDLKVTLELNESRVYDLFKDALKSRENIEYLIGVLNAENRLQDVAERFSGSVVKYKFKIGQKVYTKDNEPNIYALDSKGEQVKLSIPEDTEVTIISVDPYYRYEKYAVCYTNSDGEIFTYDEYAYSLGVKPVGKVSNNA